MARPLAVGFVLFLAACATVTGAPAQPTDEGLRKLITGGWIIAPESDDYLPGFSETLWEEFREDGAEILHVFEDETCAKEVETIAARWSVSGGILITEYEDGSFARDQIVSIDKNSMTLKFEDGLTGIFKRASGCGDRRSFLSAAA